MAAKKESAAHRKKRLYTMLALVSGGLGVVVILGALQLQYGSISYSRLALPDIVDATTTAPQLDIASYEDHLRLMVHLTATSSLYTYDVVKTIGTTTATTTKNRLWPVKTVYPNYGALLPFNRIVAYYGNFYSRGMGVLGQADATTTKAKLLAEVAHWQAADPQTPVIPAVDYIALTAQASAGFDGKYRARMPGTEIQKAIAMARSIHGITILDVQVGQSNLQTELPLLKAYLSQPDVHLAIDPEFAMKAPQRPGEYIGTFDASDVNYAANFLAGLVRENNLPPKILVVHRFTGPMVTHYKQITPLPEVEIVMDMDGWGNPAKKNGTFQHVIYSEPVQFVGFKLFYKNDLLPPSTRMMTYKEVVDLTPSPLFIQYQ